MTEAPNETVQGWLRRLAEQVPEHALVLIDLEGRIVWCNPAAERIFGHPLADLLGRSTAILFTPEDVGRGLHLQELATARTGTVAEDDRWMMRADGSRFWALGALVPIRDESGAVVGFGKMLRNRTDLREQLDHALRRLEAADAEAERKDRFLAALSHELRSPLSALGSATAVLGRACVSEPCRRPLEILVHQQEALRGIVDELLDLTRIGAGKLEVRPEPVVVLDVLLTAVESVQPLLDERRHRLAILLPDHPLRVRGDAGRLRSVFVNLVENAAKYTPPGGRIWIKGTIEGSEAVVHVQDDGVGIAPEMQPLIFDLFTQVDPGAGWSGGGLGIGLALVRSIVTAHGGTVQVRSDGLGTGSVFTVRLPLAEE